MLQADPLSRIEASSLHTDPVNATHHSSTLIIDFKDIAAAQQRDTGLLQLQSSSTSLKLQSVPLPTSDLTLVCDMSTGVPRPYVPSSGVSRPL